MKVKDFDRVVKFYTDGLGFTAAMRWGEGDHRAVMLDMGNGGGIEIFAGGTEGEKPEGAVLHYALQVRDCAAALALALAAGAIQTMAPTRIDIPTQPGPTPVRIAFCRGLGGELIEFFQQG